MSSPQAANGEVTGLATHEPDAVTQAAVTAAWLATGQTIHHLSLCLTGTALLTGFALSWHQVVAPAMSGWAASGWPSVILLAIVLIGLLQAWLAARVAFDGRIFAHWATVWPMAHAHPDSAMAAFDACLGLDSMSPRTLAARCAGARRLLHRQGLCLLLQFVLWLMAGGMWRWL